MSKQPTHHVVVERPTGDKNDDGYDETETKRIGAVWEGDLDNEKAPDYRGNIDLGLLKGRILLFPNPKHPDNEGEQ